MSKSYTFALFCDVVDKHAAFVTYYKYDGVD